MQLSISNEPIEHHPRGGSVWWRKRSGVINGSEVILGVNEYDRVGRDRWEAWTYGHGACSPLCSEFRNKFMGIRFSVSDSGSLYISIVSFPSHIVQEGVCCLQRTQGKWDIRI